MSLPPASATDGLSRLVVDLDAVARNYLFLKKMLAPGVDCAAVVKADAYGLGAAPVAQNLYRQGCRHFFVAEIDEGLSVLRALRGDDSAPVQPGQDVNVYVLDGPRGASIEAFFTKGIVPVLNSPGDIALWAEQARRVAQRLPAVLHLDTGMNRLGLTAAETDALDAAVLSAFDLRYVMSHLACAEQPQNPMNARQRQEFEQRARKISGVLRLSLANSGGVFLGPEYHYDLVRPGAAIYGLQPQDGGKNPMQNVLSLEGRILQVRTVDRDGAAGYGATRALVKGTRTATVALGYADGYFRSLSDKGLVYIAGAACPVLGRVSMDSFIVDISNAATDVATGDWAEVIGPHQSPDDVAKQAGTIGYEVLTSLGTRLKRTYHGGQS